MRIFKFFVILSMILAPIATFGADCRGLKSPKEFKSLFQKIEKANPLNLKKFSLFFEVSPCEEEECQSKNRLLRIKNQEAIHMLKLGEKQRVRFVSGANAPQCFMRSGPKDFKCTSCNEYRNENCRSYKIEGSETLIKGTNIDSADFDFLTQDSYQSSCSALSQSKDYILIQSENPQANLWQKVEIYLEKAREVPILIRFFHNDRLAKIYRFYPQAYIEVNDNWYSSQFRVRNVKGGERRYYFETSFKLLLNNQNQYHLYLEPEKDPMLKIKELNESFQTE